MRTENENKTVLDNEQGTVLSESSTANEAKELSKRPNDLYRFVKDSLVDLAKSTENAKASEQVKAWDMRFWKKVKDRQEIEEWLNNIANDNTDYKNCGPVTFCIRLLINEHKVEREQIIQAIMQNNTVVYDKTPCGHDPEEKDFVKSDECEARNCPLAKREICEKEDQGDARPVLDDDQTDQCENFGHFEACLIRSDCPDRTKCFEAERQRLDTEKKQEIKIPEIPTVKAELIPQPQAIPIVVKAVQPVQPTTQVQATSCPLDQGGKCKFGAKSSANCSQDLKKACSIRVKKET